MGRCFCDTQHNLEADMQPSTKPKDPFLVVIYALMVACAAWILFMPWVPAVAQASMRRFHLSTSSFLNWAIQQPIPSMYSFANTYEIRQWPPSVSNDLVTDPLAGYSLDGAGVAKGDDFGILHRDYINHFPARAYTFSLERSIVCGKNEDRWVVTLSTYRGQRVETLAELKAMGSGRFVVTRSVLDQP